MSAFVYTKLSREIMVRRHAAFQRVMTDLFSAHTELIFPDNAKLVEPFLVTDVVNALLHHFTEAGVRLLFSQPAIREAQLIQAHMFFSLSFSDNGTRALDLYTSLVIHFILMMYPVQNNRREARRKEIERFLTRELSEALSVEYVAYLHELLFAEDYVHSRYITFFRFTA